MTFNILKVLFMVFVMGWLTANGKVRPMILEIGTTLDAPRWMNDVSDVVTSSRVPRSLYQIRKASLSSKWQLCLTLLDATWSSAKRVQPWLLAEELRCSRELAKSKSKPLYRLTRTLLKLDRHSVWLTAGPYSRSLREESIKAHLVLVEKEAVHYPKRAWKTADRLQQMRTWMKPNQEALFYRVLGDLAMVQDKMELSQAYFIRSLRIQESRLVRRKLKTLAQKSSFDLLGVPKEPKKIRAEAALVNDLAMGEKEAKLVRRTQRTLKSGDWLAAISDGVKLIREYPGSSHSDWASKKILKIYRKVSSRRNKKWVLIRSRIIKIMKRADGERLLFWAKGAFRWGYYNDAMDLASEAGEKLKGVKVSKEAYLLAGRAANTIGKYGTAATMYERLISQHSGSKEALEGYFRWGLLNFRRGKYSLAITKFERLLSITKDSGFDLRTRYWLWRSLQKMDSDRAMAVGRALYERYPLTYYGLRALSEVGSLDKFLAEKKEVQLTHRLWLSESESRTWDRYQILIKAGWFSEAQAELRALPPPQLPIEKVLFSKLWATAFDHFQAVSMVQRAWEDDASLLNLKTVQLSFPVEYRDYVRKWADKNNLDLWRVHALIKQESTYRRSVGSVSGAIGLMQLMPPTAREVAGQLRIKGKMDRNRLTDAQLNVRLGSSYLRRLLRAYDGHFPLALAAYNVGIGNMRKWLNSRREFVGITKKGSEVEDELWIDELAWEETSHYVKAVLRNYIIYQILYRPMSKLPEPTWGAPEVD